MAARDWRMAKPCKGCPFSSSAGGKRQRAALTRARWQEITSELRGGAYFSCHETTVETEEGDLVHGKGSKLCAGAIAWQEERGCTSNYQRVCERIDGMFNQRREA